MVNGINNSVTELWPVPGSVDNGESRNSLRAKETEEPVEAANQKKSATGEELSSAEEKQVEKLKSTDRKVRQHEQAHQAAAGGLAVSGATFQYEMGPDGKRYAVGGEVKISAPSGGDPDKQLAAAQKMKRAALAPAEPSAQDRSVAASAARMEVQARMEKLQNPEDENSPESGSSDAEMASGQSSSLTTGFTAAANDTNFEPLPLPGLPVDETRPGMVSADSEQKAADSNEENRFARLPGQKEETRPGMITREAMERYTDIIRQDLTAGDPVVPEAIRPFLKEEDNSGLRVSISA